MDSTCGICGCKIHHEGEYAQATVKGRSHATKHHHVAKRFFSRSNSKGPRREPVFKEEPRQFKQQQPYSQFCYECHEELLHNPVLLPNDITKFAKLIELRGLNERNKPTNRDKIAGRIVLLHEVIEEGLNTLLQQKEN